MRELNVHVGHRNALQSPKGRTARLLATVVQQVPLTISIEDKDATYRCDNWVRPMACGLWLLELLAP